MKKRNWRKYTWEFVSIFVAVVSAFALNNWNDHRVNRDSEQKILSEIKNSLKIDVHDFNINIYGNKMSLKVDSMFRGLLKGEDISQDSIATSYIILFRDYIPIINRSAYESLKANNLKTITNDSLRIQIIALYDYHYSIIEKLEYEVPEMKSYKNYFSRINTILHPFMEFDQAGNLVRFNNLDKVGADEKKEILSYLWRIRSNRKFKLRKYDQIIAVMKKLEQRIAKELKK
ncbi:hypothetical protein BKI52_38910 [marine bacterium AO1-C]|nr:hypothetical protein BKI52_38910 [marine bacterium AO1-C]